MPGDKQTDKTRSRIEKRDWLKALGTIPKINSGATFTPYSRLPGVSDMHTDSNGKAENGTPITWRDFDRRIHWIVVSGRILCRRSSRTFLAKMVSNTK